MSYPLRRRKPKPLTDNLFRMINVYVPASVYIILAKASEEKEIPMSRLVAYALDNELDSPTPFNYPSDLPTDEYKEFMYAKEAGRVMKWMNSVPGGVNKESIMLCRRDFGIETRREVLYALRELFEKDMIEEFRPNRRSRGYTPTTKRIRIKKVATQRPLTMPMPQQIVEENDEY